MKKNNRKSASKAVKKCSLSVTALLALGIGVGAPAFAVGAPNARNIQHEMVPHVVLPETIQYHKMAKSQQTHPGLSHPGDSMVSPYVATYTPFPSYQLPLHTQWKTVGQSVYPVTPKPTPLPLPNATVTGKVKPNGVAEPTLADENDVAVSPKKTQEAEPILLASGRSDVVPATPLEPLNREVQQTGIFCQKPAKPQTAWSFSSPIFKVASVPQQGWSGGQMGYISQYGPRGCQTQVGFHPMTGQPMGTGAEGVMPPGMPSGMGMQPGVPMHTFQMGGGMGGNMGMNAGPQVQMLPNGMLMVTAPPDHARCGLFRCRCGNMPRTIFLPAGPGMMPHMMSPQNAGPNMMPSTMPQDPTAMMMPGMMSPMMNPMMASAMMPQMQPQMMPVTAMTPFGPTLVGYRPMMQPVMPYQYQQQLAMQQMYQQQMYQQQLYQQQLQQMAAMQQQQPTQTNGEDVDEPKAPLPINAPMPNAPLNPLQPFPMMAGLGMMGANPYALYAQQAGQANAGTSGTEAAATDPTMQPMMFVPPQMLSPTQSPMMMGGMVMTPYGMMAFAPSMNPFGAGNFGSNGGMDMYGGMYGGGNGFGMNPGMMFAGYGQQPMMPGMVGGGMNMSDVVQLMMLLNNSKPQRRGLFARLAERREARRERKAGDDPLKMLMQAWTTPYTPYGTVTRMPSRNAYPYGFFGAQVGPQDTANYGGVNDFYMGNTSYPGVF